MINRKDIPDWIIRAANDWSYFDLVFDKRSSGEDRDKTFSRIYDDMVNEIEEAMGEMSMPSNYSNYRRQRVNRDNRTGIRPVPVKALQAHTFAGFVEIYYKYRGKGLSVESAYNAVVSYVRRYVPEFVPPVASGHSLNVRVREMRRKRR